LINIVFQIALYIGMMAFTKGITDFFMMYIFREKKHYTNLKYLKPEIE
jgi:hypothetical protein